MTNTQNDQATSTMELNLEARTGRPLAEWLKLVRHRGLEKHGQVVSMLKKDFGVTHGYANLIAHRALKSSADHFDGVDLINAQYSGAKQGLRPIYDALIEAVSEFGPELEIAPKKTYVSLRRKKQFALIQASTRTRVDLGVNIKGQEPAGCLEASGSFNAMVSHRVRLESPGEVNAEVSGWLQKAWDAAG